MQIVRATNYESNGSTGIYISYQKWTYKLSITLMGIACRVVIESLQKNTGSGNKYLIRCGRKRYRLYRSLYFIRYHYGNSKDMLFSIIRPLKIPLILAYGFGDAF